MIFAAQTEKTVGPRAPAEEVAKRRPPDEAGAAFTVLPPAPSEARMRVISHFDNGACFHR